MPQASVPGHHPSREQDRPVDRFRDRAKQLAEEAHQDDDEPASHQPGRAPPLQEDRFDDAFEEPFDAFEADETDEETFLFVLRGALEALQRAAIPHGLLGGVASAVYGRPRWTHDIDVLVRPHDARAALGALADRGFATQERDPHWLYKGIRNGVLVDILFKGKGDIYLDEEMIGRLQRRSFQGVPVTVVPAEDLLVIKAIVHDEQTPRHWHDCLAIIARTSLDWDYLLHRARHGPHRVLSLLLYALSNGLVVPQHVIEAAFSMLYPTGS